VEAGMCVRLFERIQYKHIEIQVH